MTAALTLERRSGPRRQQPLAARRCGRSGRCCDPLEYRLRSAVVRGREEGVVIQRRAVAVAMMANALQQMWHGRRIWVRIKSLAADRMAKSRACLQRD